MFRHFTALLMLTLHLIGLTRTKPPEPFVPKFCVLDKKVLRFFGHFYESIPDGMGTETR